MSDLATNLLAAARTHDWSWVIAIGVMLLVAAVRALPDSPVTAWTKTGPGALVFAVLVSLTAGFSAQWVAHGQPFSFAVVMPALGIAAKAIAAWEAQKRARAAIKPPPTATAPVTGEITVPPVLKQPEVT